MWYTMVSTMRRPPTLFVALAASVALLTACGPAPGAGREAVRGEPARAVRIAPAAWHPAPSLAPRIVRPLFGPLRVMVVGDSVADTLQPSLYAMTDGLKALGIDADIVRTFTVPGFGLTADRPGRLDWAGADPRIQVPSTTHYAPWRHDLLLAVDQDRPDLVIMLLGAWDAIPRLVDGQWLVPGTPEWRRWYIGQVDAADALFGSTGALVAWLRFPCIRNETQSQRIDVVNGAVADAASLRPGRVTVLPFDDLVCPGGSFVSDYVAPDGRRLALRLADGVHFDMFGATAKVGPWLTTQVAGLIPHA
jgi:hypothetical protein